MTRLAVLSIGSNIERRRHIRRAVDALTAQFGPLLVSPVYETPAVGFDGPNFFNLVCAFETSLDVAGLRSRLKAIEEAHGRRRADSRLASRTLDIDLLLFGDEDLHEQGFDVPRAEILREAHVLKPLADILPDKPHPTAVEDFSTLWKRLESDGRAPRAVDWSPVD